MANKILKEMFIGRFDGVSNPTMLKPGSLSAGKNIRKVSADGGWKARKGSTLHHATALENGERVDSLHFYKNPFEEDAHFIAQCNQKLLMESAGNKVPPTVDDDFGVTLATGVGKTPGFSATVGEWWFFADGSGRPIAWGGHKPKIKGLFVYHSSANAYYDYTRKVSDKRTGSFALVLKEKENKIYLFSEERLSGIEITMGSTVNDDVSTLTVKAWRSGTWTVVSDLSDGTVDAATQTKTLAKSGVVSWTRSDNDLMRFHAGILGYAYELSWNNDLSAHVHIAEVKAVQAATRMTNKWNGEIQVPSGCRLYKNSTGEYLEQLGKIINESTSQFVQLGKMTSSDILYIKTPEPATGFGLALVEGYENAQTAVISEIESWNGASWVSIAAANFFFDTTKVGSASLGQTGFVGFDASALTVNRREVPGDPIPGYWYRMKVGATLSDDVRVYGIGFVPFPETLPKYDGCVEFKNRLFVWGDEEYPNRLRFSAHDHPFCFAGADSGFTDAFGDSKKILCAMKFYNELLVFKEDSVWLLEGDAPANFGLLKITNQVGLASPKSAVLSEVGFPGAHQDELLIVAIWQDIDGVYTFDGRKTKKVSYEIDNYFNPESSDCISATNIRSLQAFVDFINNEYHLLIGTKELVYNYATDEWYPPFERAVALTTGIGFRGGDNRYLSYGGTAKGRILRLENGKTERDADEASVGIPHFVKTRAVSVPDAHDLVFFTLRGLWASLKTQSTGEIQTTVFKDLASTGEVQTAPQAISLVREGFGLSVPRLDLSLEGCRCFSVEFLSNVSEQEMTIYGFGYEMGIRGLGEK